MSSETTEEGAGTSVAVEQAANLEYMRLLEEVMSARTAIAVPRSSQWTGTGLPGPQHVPVGPVIGRVALDATDPDIGQADFYIGPWHRESGSLVVFSWAADVANAFFMPGSNRHDLCSHVVATRTMNLSGDKVVGFVDDRVGIGSQDLFPRRRELLIPQAPGQPMPTVEADQSDPRIDTEPAAIAQPTAGARSDDERREQTPRVSQRAAAPRLRAEVAVRASIAAPRSERLTTTLATLQPDQYDLVTRPSWEPLVVQGNPGTGKTVVAAHRAAYLVHPMKEGRALSKVLLVGPTSRYRDHVRGIVEELAPTGRVQVEGLGPFLSDLRHLNKPVSGPSDGHYLDCDAEIGDLAEIAGDHLMDSVRGFPTLSADRRVQLVYESLRANRAGDHQLVFEQEFSHRLMSLPSFDHASRLRRLVPILAACAISANVWPGMSFDHVIVDEAQDVRPLEWKILDRLNSGGGWTILGDVNQRRTDFSFGDWNQVVTMLGLEVDGRSIEPIHAKRGYRSTHNIMRFANQLLPVEGRRTESLQDSGPRVRTRSVSGRTLGESVVALAIEMCESNALGTVAVIGVNLDPVAQVLRRSGWTRESDMPTKWVHGGMSISLLGSEDSRGVEFDGVVVVEPTDFPPNLGRSGQLYTSLTRANRELAVVHSKGLPDKLRPQ